jgi:CheY-like chemotaxis protein
MSPDSAPKKVLVIDDEQDIVDLISEVLARDHYEPLVATVWTEAIDAITSSKPDLLLLDLKMPTIDGSAILEFIRKEGIELPVIIVSGFLTDDVMEDLSQLGVSAFVRKPFKVAQLKAEIERAIGTSEASAPDPPTPAEGVEPAGPAGTAGAEKDVLNAFEKLSGSGGSKPQAEPARDAAQNEAGAAPTHDSEILQAFQNLSAPPSQRPAPAGTPPKDTASEADQVVEAFEKLSKEPLAGSPASAAPRPAPPEAPPTMPGATQQAAAPAAPTMPEQDVEVPLESEERRHHRSHQRGSRPRRSRGASRRNLLYMGVITLLCIFIASFLAVMQWYAAEVDMSEIKKGVTKSMKEQVKEELLKEMQNQKK